MWRERNPLQSTDFAFSRFLVPYLRGDAGWALFVDCDMLFNCTRRGALTPEFVNTASGLDLHRFNWLEDDSRIGELPHRWNHLVDHDPSAPADEISNLHHTIGGPYFKDHRRCAYADLWWAERDDMRHCDQRGA